MINLIPIDEMPAFEKLMDKQIQELTELTGEEFDEEAYFLWAEGTDYSRSRLANRAA
jgi:hypothetical protein